MDNTYLNYWPGYCCHGTCRKSLAQSGFVSPSLSSRSYRPRRCLRSESTTTASSHSGSVWDLKVAVTVRSASQVRLPACLRRESVDLLVSCDRQNTRYMDTCKITMSNPIVSATTQAQPYELETSAKHGVVGQGVKVHQTGSYGTKNGLDSVQINI